MQHPVRVLSRGAALMTAVTAAVTLAAVGACSRKESPGTNAHAGEDTLATSLNVALASTSASDSTASVSRLASNDNVATSAANNATALTGARWGAPANDGDWTMRARDYANTRYSSLSEININNVASLRTAWTFSDGTLHGHEGAPLVAGNTMYVVTPFPNDAYALHLTKPGAPVKWKYSPNPSPTAIGKACCDGVNSRPQLVNGMPIYNTVDDHTVAAEAATGHQVWRTRVDNVETGATTTMAPLVVNGKVFVGNSGGEMDVLGMLTALDLKTGKILWRAASTGPDSLVRIGSSLKPCYPWMRGKNLVVTTWPDDAWKHGAGAPWGYVSYDPDLNLVYYGTSNTGPWNGSQRPGLNLWTSGVFARARRTGVST